MHKWINKFEKNISAVTVKKPYGCGDKGPPESFSPAVQRDESFTAAAPLSCQDAVDRMFIVLQNRIKFPAHSLRHHSTERV